MRICVGLFFLSLTVLVVVSFKDVTATVHATRVLAEAHAKQGDTVAKNIATSSDNLVKATTALNVAIASIADPKVGVPAVVASLNGKHGIKEILLNIDKLTADARQTTITTMHAAEAEKTDIHQAMQEVISTVHKTDDSINGADGLVPAATARITQLQTNLAALQRLTEAGTGAVGAVQNLVESKETKQVQTNLAGMTNNLNGAAANTKEAIGYIRDTLKPTKLSFWQTVENAALSAIPGGIVQFFLKYKPQNVNIVNKE